MTRSSHRSRLTPAAEITARLMSPHVLVEDVPGIGLAHAVTQQRRSKVRHYRLDLPGGDNAP
jgi:hypothetical protein